ncbi:sigma-70 family RNA polymerase sigma factor [soil metagenome]
MRAPEADPRDSDEFVHLMTSFQPRLYGYILSLLADSEAAHDVLQETNLVLWRKAGDFTLGTNFKAWAFRTAHFQVMAHRQRQIRNRLVFDDDLVATFAHEADDHDDDYFVHRQKALVTCIEKLAERQRDVVLERYFKDRAVAEIAARLKMAANAVSQLLFRARQNLIDCVQRELASTSSSAPSPNSSPAP